METTIQILFIFGLLGANIVVWYWAYNAIREWLGR